MKKLAFILTIILLQINIVIAQSPQFAVVRPNGTTYICPSWDSAYNKAIDGDNIYLPGVTINTQVHLDKKLNLFGAGHHPDSSSATGTTIFTSNLFISKGASDGSIEGIKVLYPTFFFSDRKVKNYSIRRCYLNGLGFSNNTSPTTDSLPENTFISETILNSSLIDGTPSIKGYFAQNNIFERNIVTGAVEGLRYSTFRNNNFLRLSTAFTSTFNSISNSTFENNIFLDEAPLNAIYGNCGNSYINNLKFSHADFDYSTNCPINLVQGNISVANISDIFTSYTLQGFSYTNNYHLKQTCPGINAGSDGTDVGIYGTSQPTSEGWVPSNPHIYFKQVASQTNSNGELQIQFKVRTNN